MAVVSRKHPLLSSSVAGTSSNKIHITVEFGKLSLCLFGKLCYPQKYTRITIYKRSLAISFIFPISYMNNHVYILMNRRQRLDHLLTWCQPLGLDELISLDPGSFILNFSSADFFFSAVAGWNNALNVVDSFPGIFFNDFIVSEHKMTVISHLWMNFAGRMEGLVRHGSGCQTGTSILIVLLALGSWNSCSQIQVILKSKSPSHLLDVDPRWALG